jgi:hypothetical protein
MIKKNLILSLDLASIKKSSIEKRKDATSAIVNCKKKPRKAFEVKTSFITKKIKIITPTMSAN